MKEKERKVRFIGDIELINNLSEDEMVEKYNIDPPNLPNTIVSEFIGDITLQTPPNKPKLNFNPALLNLGSTYVLEVRSTLNPNLRIRIKELIIGLYNSGYLPCNYDWHYENIGGMPDTHQGIVVVTKSRDIGLLVTTDKLEDSSLGEDINEVQAMRMILAQKRILSAIRCIKEDSKDYAVSVSKTPIFEPTVCRTTAKDKVHKPENIITLYVYEFKYRDKYAVSKEATIVPFKPRDIKN